MATRWCWITPSVLKRAYTASATKNAEHATQRKDQLSAVRERVTKAELGQWSELLDEYVQDMDANNGQQLMHTPSL